MAAVFAAPPAGEQPAGRCASSSARSAVLPLSLTSVEHATPEPPMESLHAPQFQAPARVFRPSRAEAASAPPIAAPRPRPSTLGTRPQRVQPQSELDLGLDAAAAAPQPTAATFAELGLDARLVRALAARNIREPFAIQARALPDALAGRDVLGRAQNRVGQDAGLRPPAADPARGQHGPAPREGTPRPGPRPDPRTRPAGRRRARTAGPLRRREHHHGLRRRIDRRADRPRAGRRHRGGHAGPAHRPARAASLHALRYPGHGARRGGPHGRPGLPARGHPDPRRDARGRPADVLLRDPGPRGRPAGDHLYP